MFVLSTELSLKILRKSIIFTEGEKFKQSLINFDMFVYNLIKQINRKMKDEGE